MKTIRVVLLSTCIAASLSACAMRPVLPGTEPTGPQLSSKEYEQTRQASQSERWMNPAICKGRCGVDTP